MPNPLLHSSPSQTVRLFPVASDRITPLSNTCRLSSPHSVSLASPSINLSPSPDISSPALLAPYPQRASPQPAHGGDAPDPHAVAFRSDAAEIPHPRAPDSAAPFCKTPPTPVRFPQQQTRGKP